MRRPKYIPEPYFNHACKYHICNGCDLRSAKPIGTGVHLDCPTHFNPFDDRKVGEKFICARHERHMAMEKSRVAHLVGRA
jgi:hypothetical protein